MWEDSQSYARWDLRSNVPLRLRKNAKSLSAILNFGNAKSGGDKVPLPNSAKTADAV
jgi:hypothetical protein